MKFQSHLKLDRFLGRIMLIGIGYFRRLFVAKQPNPKGPIIVTKMIGMGSLIQAMPLFHQLKISYPNRAIILITSSENTAITQYISQIDCVETIQTDSLITLFVSTIKTVMKVRRLKPFAHLDLEVYSNLSAVLTLVCGAYRRLGFYRVTPNKALLYTDLIFFNTSRQIREIYLKLESALSGRAHTLYPIPKLPKFVRFDTLPTEYLAINVNASDLLLERRWPKSKFIQLIDTLVENGFYIVLTGGHKEIEYVTSIYTQCINKEKVFNLAGRLNFSEFLSVLSNAKTIITNDTGPMHLGAALRVPTIALWGPGNPNHYGFIPEELNVSISKKIYCSPCLYEVEPPPCRGNNICMQAIKVSDVISAINKTMNLDLDASIVEDQVDLATAGMFALKPTCPICHSSGSRASKVDTFDLCKCDSCNSLFLFPQPNDAVLDSIYNGEYYKAWGSSENGEDVKKIKQGLLFKYLEELKLSLEEKQCLDCGAATGHMMLAIQAKKGIPSGVEINPSAVEKLHKLFSSSQIFSCNIEDIPKGKSYDVIFMFDYLEHVRNPITTISAAAALLKPNGYLIGTTPNPESLSHKVLGNAWPHLKPEHLSYPTTDGLKKLGEREKLKLIICKPNKKTLPPDYICKVLVTYKIPLLAWLAKHTLTLFPKQWLYNAKPYYSGELLFMYQKNEKNYF